MMPVLTRPSALKRRKVTIRLPWARPAEVVERAAVVDLACVGRRRGEDGIWQACEGEVTHAVERSCHGMKRTDGVCTDHAKNLIGRLSKCRTCKAKSAVLVAVLPIAATIQTAEGENR